MKRLLTFAILVCAALDLGAQEELAYAVARPPRKAVIPLRPPSPIAHYPTLEEGPIRSKRYRNFYAYLRGTDYNPELSNCSMPPRNGLAAWKAIQRDAHALYYDIEPARQRAAAKSQVLSILSGLSLEEIATVVHNLSPQERRGLRQILQGQGKIIFQYFP